MATKRSYNPDHVTSQANAAANGFERTASSTKSGHTVRDWLDLHKMSARAVLSILDMQAGATGRKGQSGNSSERHNISVSAKAAWKLASDAMAVSFPDLADAITNTGRRCEVKLEPVERPHVIDNGWRIAPTIHLNFRGDASSFLDVAHEFSHATQLIARTQEFIPPMIREVAAFLGELALVSYLNEADQLSAFDVHQEWQRQNSTYLGRDALALKAALIDPKTPYDYRHNYPCARVLASLLFQHADRQKLSAVFQGTWSVADCVDAVQFAEKRKIMKNNFPEIPEKDPKYPAVEAYRTLGMMAYLDLDYWHGHSEKPIKEYFEGLLKHMKSNSLYVVIGDENKPIGYATWNVSKDQPDQIEITRQAAPFGDHLTVQRSLRARLPDVTSALAVHERSARKGQMAW